MIIKKLEDETYLCEQSGTVFPIPRKEVYLEQKNLIESILEPSDEELIAIGKQAHPFYNKDRDLININNVLQEIEEFENGLNI